jgi:holo-[acyl-carrier protein] synthase
VSATELSASLRSLAEGAERGVAALGAEVGGAAIGGVGIDAVDIERFGRVLRRRPALAARLFTPSELAYARTATDPVPRLANRFAAKEAAMKAFGVGLGAFSFTDVEVARSGLEAPVLVVHGAAESLARRHGVVRLHLSLTHTALVAMAVVVAEGGGSAVGGLAPAAGDTERP